MKLSTILTGVAVAVLVLGVVFAGEALAQCDTAAGCGDANCSACVDKVKAASAKSSCASSCAATAGANTCAEFGACSVDRNLMGASGDVLKDYRAERASDGKSYIAWKAPDFTLPTTDGGEVSLSDYQGKPVAVAILATHCNHCVDTAPMLAKLKEKYGNDLAILPVVINASSVDAVQSWAKNVGADYPLLVSTDKSVSEQFKVELVPTVVLINSKGFVTKKLVTFKEQSAIDLAFAELVGRVEMGSAKGSR